MSAANAAPADAASKTIEDTRPRTDIDAPRTESDQDHPTPSRTQAVYRCGNTRKLFRGGVDAAQPRHAKRMEAATTRDRSDCRCVRGKPSRRSKVLPLTQSGSQPDCYL